MPNQHVLTSRYIISLLIFSPVGSAAGGGLHHFSWSTSILAGTQQEALIQHGTHKTWLDGVKCLRNSLSQVQIWRASVLLVKLGQIFDYF